MAAMAVVSEVQDARLLGLCQELVACVMKILDPFCSRDERATCSQTIEDFKEQNPSCLQCGFRLAVEQNPVARHFGMQLIEHYIKFRWSSLQSEGKKEFVMQLLQYMSSHVLPSEKEAVYVKESLARITVETAKRMWPQHWPTFLSDLDSLTQCGPTQVELVLLIFRRLSEDLYTYESGLTSQRRKQMTAALSEQVESVFTFLLGNLEAPPAEHLRLTALSAVTSFVEWVDFAVLFTQECKLLVLLYKFITAEELKTAACECLLVILSRKGDMRKTAEERKKFMLLLSKEALDVILQASVKANSSGADEEQYVFLKRVCQVLVQLGTSQLAPLWSSGLPRPESFTLYLQVVLEFTKHHSQLLSLTSADVWLHFTGHNLIRKDPHFKEFLPSLLRVVRERLIKIGDPTQSNHISSEYSRLDFDGVDEYVTFFSKYRGVMTRLAQTLCQMMPRTAAQEALDSAQKLVQQQPQTECTKSSLLYLEWDSFVSYLECWTNTFKTDPKFMEAVKTGLAVITHVLSFETQDPLLLNCQFRCLQTGLIAFLEDDQQALQCYLQKVFSCVGFLGGAPDKFQTRREVTIARTLVTSCFLHLCEAHAKLLVPFLQQLYDQFKALVESDVLLYAEKCTFMESLILLSGAHYDIQHQSLFIGELLQEAKAVFQELQSVVTTVEGLIEYLGLNKHPSDPGYHKRRRSYIFYLAHTVVVVLKRTKPKESVEDCPTQLDPHQNPAYQHIMPILVSFILPVLRTLLELWSGKYNSLLSEYFQGARLSDLHPHEKLAVMGRTMISHDEKESEEIEQVQWSLSSVYESCLQAIWHAFADYGSRHLHEIGFAEATLQALFDHTEEMNHWRVRRQLITHLVGGCSEDCWDSVLIPFLWKSCHMAFTRLKDGWEIIAQRRQLTVEDNSISGMERKEITQEVLEEQLLIALSREYSHLLEIICIKRLKGATGRGGSNRHNAVPDTVAVDGVSMDEEMEDASGSVPRQQEQQQWSLYQTLTPLANRLLQVHPMSQLLYLSSFCGLAWNDTVTAIRCTDIAGLLFETAPLGHFRASEYEQLFTQVLLGLQTHGMHENNRNQLSFLAMMIYEATVKNYPSIQTVVAQLPECSEDKVKAFNKFLAQKKPPAVKKKREKFRELISGVVGKHLGEVFKRPPAAFDLPEMVFKKKAKESKVIDADLSAFFQDSSDSNSTRNT